MINNQKNLIRMAFRDTALIVSLLTEKSNPNNIDSWLLFCKTKINDLVKQLEEIGCSKDEINEISYGQCALLDEVALKHLPESQRDEWSVEPLQVYFFKSYNAGNILCDRLQQLCGSANPNKFIAEAYSVILGLGFQGRYDLYNSERQFMVERLGQICPINQIDSFDGCTLVVKGDVGRGIRIRKISPVVVMITIIILAIVMYFTLDYWLGKMISELPII